LLKEVRDITDMDVFFTAVPHGNEVEVFLLLYRAVLLYFQNTATFYRKIF
jgi:hypothetical protein